ncbi:MAG: hypothetical protein JSU69_01905 [Candidatus Zixiibacteriota bacterium]|nr:MAG: hypothetical protein JSU69_01905 [candidate division Zixibacteria bacterium]
MKLTVFTAAVLLLIVPIASAENIGSFFGTFTTGESMTKGQIRLSGGVGVADATSVGGMLAYSFSDDVDGRIKLGLVDDALFETGIAVGTDFKWQVMRKTEPTAYTATNDPGAAPSQRKNSPFDLAVGGFMEWTNMDYGGDLVVESQTVWQVGAQVIASYPIMLKNGTELSPYGRFNLRHESFSIDLMPGMPDGYDISDSKLAFGLNAGVAWSVTDVIVLYGELQFDGNDGIFLAIDFGI